MRRLVTLSAIVLSASAPCQDLGGAWYITKGSSQTVVLAGVARVDDVLGLSWLDLDLSVMVRPVDGVRIGGAVTFSAPIAKNAFFTVGVGGLASDRFEWSSVRPGLVLGFSVKF